MLFRNLLSLVFFSSLFFAVSCGTGASSGKDQPTAADSAAIQIPAPEDTPDESEDKTKRPSPVRQATGTIGDVTVTVDYGSPSVKGRKIWGELVPFGEMWRTGANEATTITVSKAVMVEGQALPAGKYALFTIPNKDKWVIIFNKNADQWGNYDYDQNLDALRVEVKPMPLDQSVEALEFAVENGQVTLKWEKMSVAFKIN